jgi:hypothetical protein
VDYAYILMEKQPDGTLAPVEHKVAGEQHMIDLDRVNGDWCVDLDVPKGGYLSRTGRYVVVGTSFTVRVLWRDGKSWRYVDLDTSLVKS